MLPDNTWEYIIKQNDIPIEEIKRIMNVLRLVNKRLHNYLTVLLKARKDEKKDVEKSRDIFTFVVYIM